MQHPLTKQSGFTLMESLVALIVLSIGMLGIAALYLESMKAGRTALSRSQAVTLAADMADRIRANATAGAAYTGPGGLNNCVAGGVDCTPAQMAAEDFHQKKLERYGKFFLEAVRRDGKSSPSTRNELRRL